MILNMKSYIFKKKLWLSKMNLSNRSKKLNMKKNVK